MPKIRPALKEVVSEKVDFVNDIHWHFDQADGNLTLGEEGSWIVSWSTSRAKMLDDHIVNFGPFATEQKAYPKYALSDITCGEAMRFQINDQNRTVVCRPGAYRWDTAVIHA